MQPFLSTESALDELTFLFELGERPGFEYPAFCIETQFIDVFVLMLKRAPEREHIVPFMNNLLKGALRESIDQVCHLLDQYKVDGSEIHELMRERKLLRNRVRRTYNKKLQVKSPKGLTIDHCNAYNNWLLAIAFWKAYLLSHDPEFIVEPAEDEYSDTPVEAFFGSELRPLWAMKQAYLNAGRPLHGTALDDISIRPHREWYIYSQKLENPALHQQRFNGA